MRCKTEIYRYESCIFEYIVLFDFIVNYSRKVPEAATEAAPEAAPESGSETDTPQPPEPTPSEPLLANSAARETYLYNGKFVLLLYTEILERNVETEWEGELYKSLCCMGLPEIGVLFAKRGVWTAIDTFMTKSKVRCRSCHGYVRK